MTQEDSERRRAGRLARDHGLIRSISRDPPGAQLRSICKPVHRAWAEGLYARDTAASAEKHLAVVIKERGCHTGNINGPNADETSY